MKSASILAALPLAAAWPAAMNPEVMNAVKRNVNPNILDIKGSGVNLHRKNTGLQHPDVPFDAKEQFIDTSDGSKWAFDPPGPDDKRGECPGLNACANHNICPHSGIWTQAETIQGLQTAYGMTPELAEGLAVISILLSGDILAGTWSIGTGYKSSAPGLLSDPKGLTGLHNKYEGDASIGRGDAYLNGGSVSVFQFRSWESLFKVIDIDGDDNFSPYKSAWHNAYTREYSIENNPYYFSGEFSGLVTSAVRGFVYGFMSNHSAENPGGYLNKDIINSFFAISGEEGNWSLKYGYERIPENWYRRPYGAAGQYGHSLADVFIELAASAAEFPQSLNLGGNTGTTNSFTGLSLSNLTGGLYDASALTDPNKLACFAYFMAEQADVDQFNGALTILNTAITALTGQLASVFKQFECPQLSNYNSNLYNLFPGYKYTGNPNSNSGDPGSTPQVRSGQVIYQKTQKED